ncbi:cytochrome c oxidase subunit II [Sphaerobacter thermophilus]|uniref:cytochrome c oxidase subunit II n=1 Tax=Sphaerobacter thermophilus TaxID=2057 RepID=UPI0039C12640
MTGLRRTARWALFAALTVALVVFVSGCAGGTPQSASDPAADNARKIWDLFMPIFWMSVVVFVIVQGIIIVALIRFRRRPNDPIPHAMHGNTKLEIAWTLAPALILAAIAVPTITTIADLARDPGDEALTVRAIGQQWWWAFEYPESGVVTADELHVPVGRPIRVELESKDIIHSFWVPRLAGKQDVVPGRTNTIHFTADAVGEYSGQCAEFCGAQHANMKFKVIVQTEEEFEAWLEQQLQPAVEPEPGSVEAQGKELFMANCLGCHTIQGTEAQGKVGPDLTHFGSRNMIAGGGVPYSTENLKEWIHNAPSVKPGQPGRPLQMPAFTRLSDEEVDALVAYLESLK